MASLAVVRRESTWDLPAPVQRYFAKVLPMNPREIQIARFRQVGQFCTSPAAPWRTMSAKQSHSTHPPGFVWDARIGSVPFVRVHVRDAFIHGQGAMAVKLFGLFPLLDDEPSPELNSAALQRYLAEAIWFPTALLPEAGVAWTAIDDDRALATLSDHGITVSLEFQFNDAGQITGTYTPHRYRERSGKFVATPWQSRYSGYAAHDGILIPRKAEAAWILEGELYPYWRATITHVDYEYLPEISY